MGGFRKAARLENENYKIIHTFSGNVLVEEAYTDEEQIYLFLSNGQYLVHGFMSDNTRFDSEEPYVWSAVDILSSDEFRDNFGDTFTQDPDIRKLRIDDQCNSI